MKFKFCIINVRILIYMIYAYCIETGCSSLYTVNDISFFKQKLRKIGSILPSNSGYESYF